MNPVTKTLPALSAAKPSPAFPAVSPNCRAHRNSRACSATRLGKEPSSPTSATKLSHVRKLEEDCLMSDRISGPQLDRKDEWRKTRAEIHGNRRPSETQPPWGQIS